MAEATVRSNKRQAHHDESESNTAAPDVGAVRKRRAYLQTMGQQLREFGTEGTSPQDHNRNTFGTSPGSNLRPPSSAGNVAANQASVRHVDTPESDAAPGEDDQLPAGAAKSASRWLWKLDEVRPLELESVTPTIAFDDLLEWSQSYFDHWHPAFPFLHAPSLLDYFRQIAQRGVRIAGQSTSNELQHIIVRSIMSISIHDRRQMSPASKLMPAILVFHSINDAIRSVQLVLTEESSILSLQALVSVQLFLITMHRYNAASRLEGLAIRMAFQLGLHRCPLQLPIPSKEAELRKRLFWSVICIDRHICIRLGTPLGIRLDESNVCYPHTEQHTESEPQTEDLERDNRLDLLDFLARHADIRGSIMQTRHQSMLHGSTDDIDQALEVEAEHTKWWNTVDEHLSDDQQTQTISKTHQVTLIVLRFESVLALHRSVLATSKKNAAYNAALQRCISASRSIINTLHKALRGFGAFDGSPGQHGYERTPLLWPSFTWAVWMSTFIILSAAAEEQVSRDIALRLSDRSVQILKHLSSRGTSWPDACIVAVQNLAARLDKQSNRGPTNTSGDSSRTAVRSTRNSSLGVGNLPAQRQTSEARLANHTPVRPNPVTGINTPIGQPQRLNNQSHAVSSSTTFTNTANEPSFPNVNLHHTDVQAANSLGTDYLAGAGNFLGIAQQYSDNPLPNEEIMHLFNGEDINYWFGNDSGMAGNSLYYDQNFH
ncbi:hypothetical protein J4E82_000548 [Alternaria postmessia]|uniref:uncharacterized protein n=1 Tax=Alternaria postmessia TaxID=1187938 RepID=UPI00222501B7|nr:uncharacterized protein J4E82_000548 [Alternaria postmessia]KAI5380591.1 hypothetical protein J4E82_000548 [Alternaria postmessia]